MWKILCLIIFSTCIFAANSSASKKYSFAIDYENDQFLLDGKPFRYVSGAFHYFRAPHQYWRDILRKMRAAGLNAVETYIEWSTHEPEPNQWLWEGDADIINFIKIAKEEDLLVILRPGPYICAERDFGGFPYWLLKLVPDIKLRTKDERYLYYAERYLNEILTKVKPYLRGNGGPVILVQVENEYGSFYSCDNEYKKKLYEIFDRHIGKEAVLFTTDGPSDRMLKCGTIPGVYGTIDFGSGANVEQNYRMMRKYTPKGPLVNSEYYPGWLTHWTEKFQRVNTEDVVKTLDEMLSLNVSVNIYMFYGGTNFGYSSGANINGYYWPQITSYDYDAPLTEAGDPTEKYFAIKEVVSKYLSIPDIKSPAAHPKVGYEKIFMTPMLDLFSKEGRALFGTPTTESEVPPTFEALGLPHWLVLYEATLPDNTEETDLILKAVTKDRALVYVDEILYGSMSRMDESYMLTMPSNAGRSLKLLVENLGHVNFGNIDVEDFKGIWGVTLNNVTVAPWQVTGFRLSTINSNDFNTRATDEKTGNLYKSPQFLLGHFVIDSEPRDTFLNTEGWGKGVAFVNGHNLGRYWPSIGPQVTLYVPAPYLRKGINNLVILELEYVPVNRTMEFQTKPILDYSPGEIIEKMLI